MTDNQDKGQAPSGQVSQARRRRTTLLTIATFGVMGMNAGAIWYLLTRGYPSDAMGCLQLILASVLPGIVASAACVLLYVIAGSSRNAVRSISRWQKEVPGQENANVTISS